MGQLGSVLGLLESVRVSAGTVSLLGSVLGLLESVRVSAGTVRVC